MSSILHDFHHFQFVCAQHAHLQQNAEQRVSAAIDSRWITTAGEILNFIYKGVFITITVRPAFSPTKQSHTLIHYYI